MIPHNKLTTQKFIERARAIHGDKYDYTKSVYTTSQSKIMITCPIHGDYHQFANNHLRGHGCKDCKSTTLSNLFRLSPEDFITSANIIHDQKYDYSKIVYNGNKNKVEIICLAHGSFWQTPANHITGYGCPHCGGSFPLNTQSFIERANIIHSCKYFYELTEYISVHKKVIMICPDHGQFSQEPAAHLSGQGCPKCGLGANISKPETQWLNSLNVRDDYRHKTIRINNVRYSVDAYDPITNTVYEFYGDFWHGNPARFRADDINTRSKRSFGELYAATLSKEQTLITAGYTIVSIWENDWKRKQKLCKQHVLVG